MLEHVSFPAQEAQETSLQRISVVDRSAATKSSARLADLRGGLRGTGAVVGMGWDKIPGSHDIPWGSLNHSKPKKDLIIF